MPLPTRTLSDDETEHLDDHNNIIKPVVDTWEDSVPADFAPAAHSHTAAATSFAPAGSIAATTVQTAIVEAASDATSAITAHTGDTVDAHDATAISVTATGAVTENNVQDAITNLDQRITAVVTVASPMGYPFSSFSGANDDARLVAYNTARTTVGSGLFGWPVILDGNRTYTFNNPITISSGFQIIDPSGAHGSDQNRGEHPVGNVVRTRQTGGQGWLNLPAGITYGVKLVGLSIDGTVSNRVFGLSSNQLQTSTFHNVSFQNGLSVFGSSTTKQLMTICTISGTFCTWNNIQDVGMNIGGSDNGIDFGRNNYDTTTALLAANKYMTYFGGLSKTYVKGLYITAEQHSAMLVSQGNQGLTFDHCIFEGRNDTHPCFGALIRDSSDFTSYVNCTFNYAMTAPASGPNAGDLGYIHHTAGNHTYENCHWRYASGQNASTTSAVYATGASTFVQVIGATGMGNANVSGQTDSVRFSPRIRCVGSSTGVVDGSATLVTV